MQKIAQGIHRSVFALRRNEYLGEEEPLIQITFNGENDNNIIVIDEETAGKLLQRLQALFTYA